MAISRRTFLGISLAASASGVLEGARKIEAEASAPDLLVLENDQVAISLNRRTGCVESLFAKQQDWKLRGAGMRLHVPAPEHRYHYLTERNAGPPAIELSANSATLTWTGFNSDRLGKLDIEVKESIRLDGAGVHFSYQIRNGSKFVVESYAYPRLAGLKPADGDKTLRQVAWGYSGMASNSLWPNFGNEVGYYGFDTPAQIRHLGTDSQFCLVLGDSRGFYLGYQDSGQALTVQVNFSLTPAYSDSFNSHVSDPAGKIGDPAISIDPNHFSFIAPGASQHSEELVLEPFSGTWHAGADIYKSWRSTWHKKRVSPAWVQDVHSWQQIQINSAEDRLEFPYRDLPRYAEACKRWGVKAIQLTGWQTGGQDRNFPLHDTEPRLGTAQEFKDAIAESRKLGVEIILFNKYAWADVTGPAFESDFKRFAIEDPYGNPYMFNGYDYDTPTQISGINARHGVGMCQASPIWRKRALIEFRKSVDLGASGILFDECQWHMSPLCFSKSHGHAVPGEVFSGDVPLIDGFRTIIDPEQFLFAGESPYDVELQTYNMSYFRIANGFTPFGRYIDPFAPMSVAVTGFDDRQMINACLLYRFAMSYEPRDFHGELDEMPSTMTYGRLVDDFRRKYRDWIWDAEFRDTLGARVVANGKPYDAYTVFRRKDGLRGVVIANMSDTDPIVCEVDIENIQSSKLNYASPEATELRPWPGRIELTPGFAALVLEG